MTQPVEEQLTLAEPAKPLSGLARAAQSSWWPMSVLERVASVVLVVAMGLGLLVTLGGTLASAFGSSAFTWSQDAGTWMLVILGFVGGAVGYRQQKLAALNWFQDRLSARGLTTLDRARDTVVLIFSALLLNASWSFAHSQMAITEQDLHVSEFWIVLALPVGACLMVLFSVERLLLGSSIRYAGVAIGVILSGVFLLAGSTFLHDATAGTCMAIAAVACLVMLSLGMAIPFSFGICCLIFCYLSGTPFVLLSSDLPDSLNTFTFVAIPFFLYTGFLMASGRLSEKLAGAFRVLLSRVPGNILHVIVVSMYFFSGVSGSKLGDMAAVAKSTVKIAESENYPASEAVAVVCAAGAMADTIPPSVGLIVLASVALLSVGGLFAGGLLPATAVAIVLMGFLAVRYRRHKPVSSTVRGREKLSVIAKALPVIIIPVILIGGILSGVTDPISVSAVAVVVSLLIIGVVYRSISWRSLVSCTVESSILAGCVLFIAAMAELFGRVLTQAEIPQDLANFITSEHLGKWGFLILSTIVLILMGMAMEGLPALLVFAPLFVPIAEHLGIPGLQYGIIVVVALGIGTHTPPVGISLYVGASIGEVPVREVNRRMLPYLIPLYVGLALVIGIPQLVTWLPSVLHLT